MNNDFYVTPCKSICKIKTGSATCVGCGRTREEISSWTSYTHEERIQIMKRLGYGRRKKRDRRAKGS